MKTNFNKVVGLRRLAYGATALAVSAAAVLPALSGQASAAQVTSRYVQLSNSAPTNANTIYKVGFTVSNAATNIGGIAIDICSNTPITGDACTAPTGFASGFATLSTNNQTNISGLSVDTTNSTANKIILTRTAGAPTAAAISFELGNGTTNGVTNPTAVSTTSNQGTFYARVYTYTATGGAATHNTAAPTGFTDNGGIAMSTASQINLTAKVQETLTFCVYTGAACTNGGTAVALGDTNGVLRSTGEFVDRTTKYDVATNASSGVAIKFKAGLPTSGANTLASIGTTATSSSAGTTQFGLCTFQFSGSGLTASAPYDNAGCSGTTQTAGTGSTGGATGAQFAFDTTPAATTFGDDLAAKTAGASSTGYIAYVGNISNTQSAGIYTNTFTFIATGTF